ncbi:MAG TPA: hypothetical protein VN796_11155 [Acidimicrobiales bacterium]|nr:hypothetical protein [Acidimicrobiales bacterium]
MVRDEKQVTVRTCGFTFTTTGRPCANHVADDELYCRAGHPCIGPTRHADIGRWAAHHGTLFPAGSGTSTSTVPDRRRRASLLLARALSHEDAEADGVCADWLLADPAVALALLGSPDAAPEARDAVIQRFGLVGALLVVAHEDRWQRHLAVLSGNSEATSVADPVAGHLERLVKNFAHIDARRLETLLGDIDRAENATPTSQAAARHRLHAAYAVAARDGSDFSHHEYMKSLNEVLKNTRPPVAS